MTCRKKPLENVVERGENAGNQHFLLFLQFFSTLSKTNFTISALLKLLSANALNLDKSFILSFGKELRKLHKTCNRKKKKN